MFIISHRKIWYWFSGLLLAASLVAVGVWGLKFGIDFTGGSIIEVHYTGSAPTTEAVGQALETAGVIGSSVRPTGDNGFLIRTPFLDAGSYSSVKSTLVIDGMQFEEKRFDSIGPVIGTELQTRAVYAIILVLLTITLFIAFAFRKVSRPVASWKYGLVALMALAHDVIVPLGAFAVMGHFLGAEVDTLFVTALLVILGFSVHDTIVVFDRTRENLRILEEKSQQEPFDLTVGKAVNQTLARSVNTSLTTVLALVALYVFGPETTKYFTLTLLIGIIAGTYSSIFLGSPLLVTLQKLQKEVPVETSKKKK